MDKLSSEPEAEPADESAPEMNQRGMLSTEQLPPESELLRPSMLAISCALPCPCSVSSLVGTLKKKQKSSIGNAAELPVFDSLSPPIKIQYHNYRCFPSRPCSLGG